MYICSAPYTISNIWNYLSSMGRSTKKVVVTSAKLGDVPTKFEPVWYANLLLLKSEFEEGKVAYVKYARGKLSITVGKQPKKRYG